MAKIEERLSSLLANQKTTESHSLIEATTAPIAPAGKKEVLKRISALHAEGHSTREIAGLLESEGIPTLSGKGKWSGGTVQKLLQKTEG
jgi:hypothetical protein